MILAISQRFGIVTLLGNSDRSLHIVKNGRRRFKHLNSSIKLSLYLPFFFLMQLQSRSRVKFNIHYISYIYSNIFKER